MMQATQEIFTNPKILVVDHSMVLCDWVRKISPNVIFRFSAHQDYSDALLDASLVQYDVIVLHALDAIPKQSLMLAEELRGLPGYTRVPIMLVASPRTTRRLIEFDHSTSVILEWPCGEEEFYYTLVSLLSTSSSTKDRVAITSECPRHIATLAN